MNDLTTIAYKNNARKLRLRAQQRREACFNGLNPDDRDFTCARCRRPVIAERAVSGVGNRNHCPYCLCSRHMDWREPGDRLSACKQAMPAVALTLKRSANKYARGGGELMLVHLCPDCGRVSANRIAADDDPQAILAVFERSLSLPSETHAWLQAAGVAPLAGDAQADVRAQLFGNFAPAGLFFGGGVTDELEAFMA
jgi:ribosomal protein L37AE/L43A